MDLGLQKKVSLLPAGTFPTMFQQMRSLTTNNGVYSLFDEYNPISRECDRFFDHWAVLCNRKGSFLDYLTDFDNWTTKHLARLLGLEDALFLMGSVIFQLSSIFVGCDLICREICV